MIDVEHNAVAEDATDHRGRVRILLAEDDSEVRHGLSTILEQAGYRVEAVSNGSELLERLSAWVLGENPDKPTDIIITDVRMPGFNGFSVVEGLRAGGWNLPIVVISAFTDERLERRVRELGDVIFLPKPFDLAELEATLAHLAEEARDARITGSTPAGPTP
jgi:CheY-like chemotaxis protein